MMKKRGFAYYNTDTDRYQDYKIKRLKKAFGCNGVAIYDYILCEIYRVEGCFIMWDESTAFDVAEYWGLKESTVNEIVSYCCNVGLFNKELRASENVLSSLSIQRRFTEMNTRSKRKGVEIPEKIRILPEETPKIPEELPKVPEVFDRVEKSRVDKSRENTGRAPDLKDSNLFRQPKIPTQQQVREAIISAGGTEEMVSSFYSKHEATGWFLNGSPIVNFKALANKFIANWKANESKPNDWQNGLTPDQIKFRKAIG